MFTNIIYIDVHVIYNNKMNCQFSFISLNILYLTQFYVFIQSKMDWTQNLFIEAFYRSHDS